MSGLSQPAPPNPGSGSDSRPRQVMNVAVLAESELGSEAQRERRKRILDATLAIASKGGYEAVQMAAKILKDRSAIPASKTILIPTVVIQKNNVDEYTKKLNQLLGITG